MGSPEQPMKPQAVSDTGSRYANEPSHVARMQQLMQAAETVFLAKGYHGATMNEVAKAAGMSKKTIYKLVDSKADLLAALLEQHAKKLPVPVIEAHWSIHETLVQLLVCLGEYILSPQRIAISRLVIKEFSYSNDFPRIFHQKRVKSAKSALDHWLSEIGPPVFCRAVSLKEKSSMLFGMALGEFQIGALFGSQPIPTKTALTRRVRCAVDVFLSGLEQE